MYLPIGIFRWEGIAKATGTKSRENIRVYLWNPSVHQAIIWSEGLSGRKYLREPRVRVSKNHLTRVEERLESQSIGRGIKDPNTTQWRRGSVRHTAMLVKVLQ